MEENELLNSGETNEASPEPQQEVVESQGEAQKAAPTEQAQQGQEENLPFHQHPRFKELVSQKNEFATKAQSLEKQVQELSNSLKAFEAKRNEAPKAEDPLLSRLKSIDPEFGNRFGELDGLRNEIQQFKEWRNQMDMERVRSEALNTISRLHEENKVPQEWRDDYQTRIELEAMRNPNIGLKDLPQLYSKIHGEMGKKLENYERSITAKYSSAKKADASIPTSQPKGKPVQSGKKDEFTGNRDLDRQKLVDKVLRMSRAEKEV